MNKFLIAILASMALSVVAFADDHAAPAADAPVTTDHKMETKTEHKMEGKKHKKAKTKKHAEEAKTEEAKTEEAAPAAH